ncbi:MAG: chaperonin GroEL, partial [Ignavibacteria bacterium]|nr:chaperonin GroEL [Ignavibacteria bacterium]
VLKIGAATEVEMKEKKARVEDALHATRAAVEEGIVPGGGVALIRVANKLDAIKDDNHDIMLGVSIIRKAIEEPIRQIVANAGMEGSVIVNNVKLKTKKEDTNYGYNAFSDKYEDLVKAGVIDPTKVTRVALENAASVASMLLMTEATIVERPEKDKAPMGMPPGMGGGMGDMY